MLNIQHPTIENKKTIEEVIEGIIAVNLSDCGETILLTNAPREIVMEQFKKTPCDTEMEESLLKKGYYAELRNTFDPYYDPLPEIGSKIRK